MEENNEVPVTVSMLHMRRNWWITYKWELVAAVGDEYPMYLRSGFRPIEQAKEASEQFDIAWRSKNSLLEEVKS